MLIDHVAVVLVFIDLLLKMEDQVMLLAQLDGKTHKGNNSHQHEDHQNKQHFESLFQIVVLAPCCGLVILRKHFLNATVGVIALFHC